MVSAGVLGLRGAAVYGNFPVNVCQRKTVCCLPFPPAASGFVAWSVSFRMHGVAGQHLLFLRAGFGRVRGA